MSVYPLKRVYCTPKCTLGSVLDPGTTAGNKTDRLLVSWTLYSCGGRQALNTQATKSTRVEIAKKKITTEGCTRK